uniref:EF-hand domain-containing protein n=1 Tax=Clytia hemisphaerica TaxID=252671 RepID=A0A7M5UNA6_9CNID
IRENLSEQSFYSSVGHITSKILFKRGTKLKDILFIKKEVQSFWFALSRVFGTSNLAFTWAFKNTLNIKLVIAVGYFFPTKMDLLFGTGGDASSFALLFRSKPKASKQNNQQTEENAFALKYAGSEDDNHSLSTIGREYKDDDRVPLHTYLDLGLDGLIRETNFTREEIQRMYRGFKQECPRGLLDEETFLAILNMLFPGGDPTLYCSRIFNTFDRRKTGKLTFE